MRIFVKCNQCNEVFWVDSYDVRQYESMLNYADSLLWESTAAQINGLPGYGLKKLTESNFIKNSASNPYKCPHCGSTNCHRMSDDELTRYKAQTNAAIEKANEEKRLKQEREKAFSTQINPNATIEQLKERILTYIEDEEWFMAEHYIEHTLDISSSDYYLYYLKFLTIKHCKGNEDLRKSFIVFDENDSVCAKIFRYADEGFKKQMADHNLNVAVDLACSAPDKKANEIYIFCSKLIFDSGVTEETELGKKLYNKISKLLSNKQGDLSKRYDFLLKCYENNNNTKYSKFLIDIYLEALSQNIKKGKSYMIDRFMGNDLLFNKFIVEKQEEIVSQLSNKYKLDASHVESKSQCKDISYLLKHISIINSKISNKPNSYKDFFDQKLNELSGYINNIFDEIDKINLSKDSILNEYNNLLECVSCVEQLLVNDAKLLNEINEIKDKCKNRIEEIKREIEIENQQIEQRKVEEWRRQEKNFFMIFVIGIIVVIIVCFIVYNI